MKIKINKKNFVSYLIILFILFLCSLLNKFKVSTYASIIAFVFLCINVYMKHPRFYIKYFAIVFSFFAGYFSLCLIEFSSIYMSEIQSYSSFQGTIPLYTLSIAMLTIGIILFDKKIDDAVIINSDNHSSKKSFLNFMNLIIFIMYIGLFLQVYKHPSFLLGLQRVGYATEYGVKGIWEKISGLSYSLVPIPLYMIVAEKNKFKKIVSFLSVSLLVLYALWTGNKFGPFLIIIYIFLIIYGGFLTEKKIKKMIVISVILILSIIGIALNINNITSKSSNSDYLETRLSAQNQIYWKIMSVYDGKTHLSELPEEISGQFTGSDIVSENIGSKYGIYKMMYIVAPQNAINRFLSGGYRYTYCGYASMLYYFGYIGPIIYSIFSSLLFVLLTNSILKSFKNNDYISAIICMRLFIISQTAINMFLFYQFWDVISILSYIYLLFFKNKKIVIK